MPDYLNLALINLGEAVSMTANLRLRGHAPGDHEFRPVEERLLRAAAALRGEIYTPEVAEEHRNATS
jgi:hypothetical protein